MTAELLSENFHENVIKYVPPTADKNSQKGLPDINTKNIHTKEPYILSKEPYILIEEPCTLRKRSSFLLWGGYD